VHSEMTDQINLSMIKTLGVQRLRVLKNQQQWMPNQLNKCKVNGNGYCLVVRLSCQLEAAVIQSKDDCRVRLSWIELSRVRTAFGNRREWNIFPDTNMFCSEHSEQQY